MKKFIKALQKSQMLHEGFIKVHKGFTKALKKLHKSFIMRAI